MVKKRVNLSLDKEVYSFFQRYCEENGMVVSKKVELYMKEEMKRRGFTAYKKKRQ